MYFMSKEEFKTALYHGYMCKCFDNPKLYCGFLPGHGTTLFIEKKHFIIEGRENIKND